MTERMGSEGSGHQQANGERVERPRVATPRIYVASLSDYNAGVLHGEWIDADQDPDELNAAVQAMLAASREDVAEEWAVHDYEGFGPFRVGEYESLSTISAVGLGIAEHGPAFAAYVSWAGTDQEALGAFENCYLGRWDSLNDYARDVVEDFGWNAALAALPDAMQSYVDFDYDGFAHFLETDMNIVEGDDGIYVFTER
jgi:antirestriction protein